MMRWAHEWALVGGRWYEQDGTLRAPGQAVYLASVHGRPVVDRVSAVPSPRRVGTLESARRPMTVERYEEAMLWFALPEGDA